MDIMICICGDPEQLPFLPEISKLGAGIELGSYGLVGIRSEQDWHTRVAMHEVVRDRFNGKIAIHGPFVGMEFAHIDHMIRDAVHNRMDMTFDVAKRLRASRIILHSGYTPETDLFNLQDVWLNACIEFWQHEIGRWADAGIEIVLENDTQKLPDIHVQLVNAVDNPFLHLCLDIGHQHMFSDLDAVEWVRRMDTQLAHIHLHDNDRRGDNHWSLGRGTIDFEPFYASIIEYAPHATISLEVEDTMDVKMGDLRMLAARFANQ